MTSRRAPAWSPPSADDAARQQFEQRVRDAWSNSPSLETTMEKEPARRLVNITQAQEIAGVSKRTIYNWIRLGKVEWVHTAGRGTRVYADTLFRKAKQESPA